MPAKTIPSLFCTNCLSYYPPAASVCPICGSRRESHQQARPPLTPNWQISVPGKPVGTTVIDDKNLLTCWNHPSDETKVGLPEGGLQLWNLETQTLDWEFSLDRPAIGAPVVFDDLILQLTGRRAPDPARLLVFSRDHELVWTYDFTNPVTPIILPYNLEWICFAVSDGTIMTINPSTHKSGPIARWDSTARLNAPQALVVQNMNTIYLATGTRPGQVLRIQGKNVTTLFTETDYVYLTDLLAPRGQFIYTCDEHGRLFALNALGQPVWTYQIEYSRNPSSRLGSLAILNDRLFFGAADHQMRCLDRHSGEILWETELNGTVMVRPLIWNDALLICGDSHGHTYGLEVQTGKIVWQYGGPSGGHWSTSGNLDKFNDRAFFSVRTTNPTGDPSGRLWSMPFHAGQHTWAAHMLEDHREYHEAAEQYALQAHWCDVCDQDTFLEKAANAWEKAQEPEWGARLWQGVGDRKRAAVSYDNASQIWRIRDPARAAYYSLLSAEVLEQANQPEEAEKSRKKAEALSPLPFLCLELATNPTLTQYENGEITLRLKNTGRAAARNVVVYVGGTLLHAVHFAADPQEFIPPNRWWDLTLTIAPTQPENQLDVCVECVDRPERSEPFRNFFSGRLLASPAPVTIKTGDMVKGKLKLKGWGNNPIRLEMGDSVMSEIEIEA